MSVFAIVVHWQWCGHFTWPEGKKKTVEAGTAVISEATKFVNNALEVLFLRNGDLRIC